MNTINRSDEICTGVVPADKIRRYGWVIKDEPGKLDWIDKLKLDVDHTYQRSYNLLKSREMASAWSWISCAAIVVAKRPSGELVVVDGQHRVLASLKRSDIRKLPCVIFEIDSIEDEAKGFSNINKCRKPMSSLNVFKADLVARDPEAIRLSEILDKNKVHLVGSSTKSPMSLKSVASCRKMIRENEVSFERTVEFISELCKNDPIYEVILSGLYYIDRHLTVNLDNARLRKRLLSLGPALLKKAATREAALYSGGGSKIWAIGIIKEANKVFHAQTKLTWKAEIDLQ
jgi:hypothetical protein